MGKKKYFSVGNAVLEIESKAEGAKDGLASYTVRQLFEVSGFGTSKCPILSWVTAHALSLHFCKHEGEAGLLDRIKERMVDLLPTYQEGLGKVADACDSRGHSMFIATAVTDVPDAEEDAPPVAPVLVWEHDLRLFRKDLFKRPVYELTVEAMGIWAATKAAFPKLRKVPATEISEARSTLVGFEGAVEVASEIHSKEFHDVAELRKELEAEIAIHAKNPCPEQPKEVSLPTAVERLKSVSFRYPRCYERVVTPVGWVESWIAWDVESDEPMATAYNHEYVGGGGGAHEESSRVSDYAAVRLLLPNLETLIHSFGWKVRQHPTGNWGNGATHQVVTGVGVPLAHGFSAVDAITKAIAGSNKA